ncbi:MAG: hypothetical protein KatS3mg111_3594 [Pirellulaceae bacterium]|nr:MAG: hypothetical protein KatS3mg111_3594 [Pirellulaceae bacterium]
MPGRSDQAAPVQQRARGLASWQMAQSQCSSGDRYGVS